MAACLRLLRERHRADLFVVRVPPSQQAPFDEDHFEWIDQLYDRNSLDTDDIERKVRQFSPDVVFVAGWFDDGYLRVTRAMREQGVLVVAGCDTQWTGSWRQQVGRVLAPWYLHSAIDVLWVAGERQRQLAHRLGYTGSRCWTGYYACNWPVFAQAYQSERSTQPSFLYAGRYTYNKDIQTLIEAYREYRNIQDEPWPLICAGTGEEQNLLEGEPGVVDKGFVQPDRLPDLMQEASVFVLPSRREPWGVVVQEAAAAGLPLICSDACGAAVHLLQDGYNGFLFETENVQHLAYCMKRMSSTPEDERAQMSSRSHELSKQYTPQRWTDTLVEGVERVSSQELYQSEN